MDKRKMTLEEANNLQLRELDIERLEAEIPRVHETKRLLKEAQKISPELLRKIINI